MPCPIFEIFVFYIRYIVSYPQLSMNGAKLPGVPRGRGSGRMQIFQAATDYSIFPNPRLMVAGSLVGGWQAVPVQR